MDVLNKLGRLIRLGGILGLALGALAVSVCSDSPGADGDAATQDAAGPVDAAAQPDGGVDGTVTDAQSSTDAELPDARLWDVLCE
ncbi:MAG: hypothetical protein ABI333_07475 [bacterium]